MEKALHSIQAAAQLSGLSAHVIRAWEKRYKAVAPQRSEGNQRKYTSSDIERLGMLKQAIEKGFRIGDIAGASEEELNEIVGSTIENHESSDNIIENIVLAVRSFDREELAFLFRQASQSLGVPAFISKFIPLVQKRIGDYWESGDLRIFHERFISEIIRSLLGEITGSRQGYFLNSGDVEVVAATLTGQRHELGVLAATALLQYSGKGVLYLGPSIPVEEIIDVVTAKSASTILLGFSYPQRETFIVESLLRLNDNLPKSVQIIIGGAPAAEYAVLTGFESRYILASSIMDVVRI